MNNEYRTEPLEFALASESGELGEANIECRIMNFIFNSEAVNIKSLIEIIFLLLTPGCNYLY